ncbi:MAG: DNA topoisomerase IV subunit A [Planctomycetes bacterium]|nr:DNA topoisomerase IV subunit A [Planctomycetota bacterium]
MARAGTLDRETATKLTKLADHVVGQIRKKQNPGIDIPIRALSNVRFDPKKRMIEMGQEKQARTFFNASMARKFMQTLLLASAVKKELLASGKTTSIRDLYYMTKHTVQGTDENTFEEQDESDPIIEDLEVAVDALREELHLFASNKGAMVGDMTIVDQGDTIDLRRMGSGGWSIPSIVEPNLIQFKKVDAKFVLLVEKDAMWRRLNEDKFWQKHHCVLLHGQGQPPRGVRRLCSRMVNELKLPLYVFVDNDPWGYYIYSVVKQGSINLAYESQRMAVPSARFVGLSSFDKDKFKLPSNVTIKLNDEDTNRAKQLLNYEWFQSKPWQAEIRNMLRQGVKLELEALSKKDISFATDEYLPKKLKDKEWLD